ncbi:MAG: hypothetical protein AB7V13_13355 [Pseudorhodoplanes sp.]
MGNFYTNFEIFGGEADDLLRAAKELRRRALVIVDRYGNQLLFDAACDDQDVGEIERLGSRLAERLKTPLLACLNHDDDHLWLWLFHAGQVYRYQSVLHGPAFAWRLSRIRGGLSAFPLMAAVLTWPTFIFQVIRHTLLNKVASLSPLSPGLGYTYLKEREWPEGLTEDEILRV